ncbi:arginine decarboxylase, pyruvoyl-dependent [Candidatus Desantisbacteria bacterium CG2_30_40_21]|uniref:Pyruvoyl-dependent arginine decarboxylase AaxB n=4 Tax=unclassified Candidatus Desantisiibacteriota TaxID=3106372 RepID=A0A2M7JCM5_9BACT|nr:MAG: arginine decarboxylase, pyruvoyl-dependent [Candidatus Desantisbacteria bacterium CG2_30_40_21]PIX17169.1 MAG: arginine decarboxylase, pyruvoyl-dependent [Candidatus Desantisbacteria bacterium CG_4_8_14_3_um_filter_40_12]PIY19456.1 MAG: arginine decarboxylase, pyruvoyl-dependent [Candidatus Desantisbacteria bacterium CG_4_10_14_3_um_filter_40_18]PJB29145.1 MAG: arginine decarboxylase, pyruvoyl-dependent [Candidatus Desantisbacteria bacterium CG_4_9_14_3_um_filter_40_11]
MIPIPTKMAMTSGGAEGLTKLNAFDHALLAAGIGNINLIKVSSIVPPGIELIELPNIPGGSLTPMAYATITSDVPGEMIAAAVAAGFHKPDHYGVIMEYSGKCTAKEASKRVISMVEEAFVTRGIVLNDVKVTSTQHVVVKTGSVIAAAVLLY